VRPAPRAPTSASRGAGALLLALAAFAGCGGGGQASAPKRAPAPRAHRVPALCGPLRATVTGRVRDPAADELSGLAASPTWRGLWWSHDDSGGPPALFALRADGTERGRFRIPDATNVDWEDIAAGPGATLIVGDIGDNAASRPSVALLRVPEPSPRAAPTAPPRRLELRYPDGPHDAETLLVDPLRGDVVVVTKALGPARAYVVPPGAAGSATLRRGPRVPVALATAGDVSADGRVVAVRGYGELAVWLRRGREPLARTLRRRPCRSPTVLEDGQGEALALDRHGTSFLTVAEGSPAVLRRYAPASR
jgi:hypothetical protein